MSLNLTHDNASIVIHKMQVEKVIQRAVEERGRRKMQVKNSHLFHDFNSNIFMLRVPTKCQLLSSSSSPLESLPVPRITVYVPSGAIYDLNPGY